jgi:hypothetical protein
MLAVRERLEPVQVCTAPRVRERRQSSRFRGRVAELGSEPLATPRGADPRQVGAQLGREVPLSADQSVSARCRSTRLTTNAKLHLGTRRILVELAQIALADIGDVFDEHGAVIPFADLPPGVRSAIAEYRVRHYRNGTCSVRVKLHPKLPALAALGRYLGILGHRSANVVSEVSRMAHRSVTPRSTQPDMGIGL